MKSLGVVIGRFQVAGLTAGHHAVIDMAVTHHDQSLILVGVSPVRTRRQCLDFAQRRDMLQEAYPTSIIAPLEDHPNDVDWVKRVDAVIAQDPEDFTAVLYWGRDSSIDVYTTNGGRYPCILVPEVPTVSGTASRRLTYDYSEVLRESFSKPAFREGIIYAHQQMFPTSYQVVDVAIFHEDQVLLAQKTTDGDYWRLIGGFVDPTDHNLEMAARREVMEETGLAVGSVRYCGSARVDDWRYRNETDKILSAVFRATRIFGHAEARDDIRTLKYVPVADVSSVLYPAHQPLWALIENTL